MVEFCKFPLAMLLEWGMVGHLQHTSRYTLYIHQVTASHLVYHVPMLSQQLQLASSVAVDINLEMHGNSTTCTIEKVVVRQQC